MFQARPGVKFATLISVGNREGAQISTATRRDVEVIMSILSETLNASSRYVSKMVTFTEQAFRLSLAVATDSVNSSRTTLCINHRLESSRLIESESTDSLLPTLVQIQSFKEDIHSNLSARTGPAPCHGPHGVCAVDRAPSGRGE